MKNKRFLEGSEKASGNNSRSCRQRSPLRNLIIIPYRKLARLFEALDQRLTEIHKEISAIQPYESEQDSLQQCVQMVAECQRQTAAALNSEQERHALIPALQAMDELSLAVLHLARTAESQAKGRSICQLYQPVLDLVTETAKLAHDRREGVGMEAICPEQGCDFDPRVHEIKDTIITEDTENHRKIADTLVPGLIHRNKVIRKAKVAVFRFPSPPPASSSPPASPSASPPPSTSS